MSTRTRLAVLLTALVALLVATVPAAEARKVANPRNFTAEVTGGVLRIADTSLDLSTLSERIHLNGPITDQGVITIPKTRLTSASQTNGIYFPDISLTVDGTTYKVRVVPTHNWTGSVNPMTGAMNLYIRFRLEVRGGQLGDDGSCKIGSDSDPIELTAPGNTARDLRTGRTSPPGPAQPIEGDPYDATTGTTTLVNNEAAINEKAGGCGPLGLGNDPLNEAIGLPSPSGNNEARLQMIWGKQNSPFQPIRKAVNAAFTASPATGVTPVTTELNAASSFASTSVTSYRWDFENDGTWDTAAGPSPVASHTYTTPGTYQAKLRVTDVDGDADETTRAITVNPKLPDLSLAKAHEGNLRVGRESSYALTVTNAAASVAGPTQGAVTIVDDLPAGLTYSGFTGSGWSCSAAGQKVTCTNPFTAKLQPGASSTVNVEVTPTAQAMGDVVNTATVSTPGETATGNNGASDPTTVEGVDLALTKSHPGGAFQVTQVRTYNLDVENEGTAATDGPVTVTDTLPAGLTYNSAAGTGWGCTAAGQTVTCTRATPIAAGATSQLRLRVDVGGVPRSVVNTATVSTAHDVDGSNDGASDTTPIFQTPDLAITKTDNGELRVGAEGSYTLSVANEGTKQASGDISVTDELPDGLTFVSATGDGWACDAAAGTVTCTRSGDVPAGATLPGITLTVAAGPAAAPVEDDAPAVENTATVGLDPADGADADPNPDNDSSTATTAVRRTDLTLTKTHGAAFRVGAQGVYEITVRNRGTLATSGTTTVTDTLPEGMSFAGAEGEDWSCAAPAQTVTCTRTKAIPAGAQAPAITLTVDVGAAAAPSKTNTATVANADDHWSSNDTASDPTPVTQVDLALTNTAAAGPFRVGQTRSWTLGVKNNGIASTGPTTVVDTLPEGVELLEAAGQGWLCSAQDRTVTCGHADLIAADAVVPPITISVRVLPGAVPSVTNTATVTTAGDNNLGDNTAAVTRAVVGPDVAVELGQAAPFRATTTGTYEIDVANEGTGATTEPIVVTDQLPAGLTYRSAAGDGWACSAAGQQVTCTRTAALGAGAEAPRLSLKVDVLPAAGSEVDNGVAVQTPGDTDTTNDAATLTSAVGATDAAIEKELVGDLRVGEGATYLLKVRNAGTAATSGAVRVTDTLPEGLTPSAAAGDRWSCSTAGRKVTCVIAALAAGEQAPDITLEAVVGQAAIPAGQASAPVTNTASVQTPGDAAPANDSDGATATATRGPDAAIALRPSTGTAPFRAGSPAFYAMTVRNAGTAPTTGPAVVTTTLAPGLTVRGTSGQGWTCSTAGQKVTCTRSAAMTPGERSDLRVDVNVGSAAVPAATTVATVEVAGDGDDRNDTARDEARRVEHVDVSAGITHTGAFRSGGTGSYAVTARNDGTATTVGPTTAVVTMGQGLTPTRAAGTGWTCALGAVVRCRYDGTLAQAQSTPPIRVDVEIGGAAAPRTTPQARVSTPDDARGANDTASDPTAVLSGAGAPASLRFGGGEIVVGKLPALDIAQRGGGKALVLNGTLDPDGRFTVPTSGLSSPSFEVIAGSGINATLALVQDAVGSVDRGTGAVRLPLRLRLSISGPSVPAGCGLGSAASPIVVDALVTGASGSLSGSPINSTNGALTLVNQTFGVPRAQSCGALDAAINDAISLPSAPGANRLVLRGTYTGPKAGVSNPKPPGGSSDNQDPKPPVKVAKAALTAAKRQRAVRDRVLRMTVTPSENARLKAKTTIKVKGVKKAIKLKTVSVKLRKGRPVLLKLKLTKATRTKLRRAIKKGRKVTATVTTSVTGAADKKVEKRKTTIRIVG